MVVMLVLNPAAFRPQTVPPSGLTKRISCATARRIAAAAWQRGLMSAFVVAASGLFLFSHFISSLTCWSLINSSTLPRKVSV